jgi:hypothetical protein
MARTIVEIQAAIIAEKESYSELDGLSTTSEVSIWRLWTYITAAAIWAMEILFDKLTAEIIDFISRNRPGTAAWYVEQAYKYQYGYELTINDLGQLVYETIDESAKVVKRAAIERLGNGQAVLKVANFVSGEAIPLTTPEKTSFDAYVYRIMFPGSFIQTRSLPADDMNVYAQVYYNPEFTLADITTRTETAILDYIANVPFNGYYKKIRLVDAIQLVNGVRDVKILNFEAKPNSASIFTPIDLQYNAQSGYAKIFTPLSGSITYIPEL